MSAEPPSTPSRSIPKITTSTTPNSSHTHARRQSSSYASPIDFKPKSPAARRMSMTATSQTAAIAPIPSSLSESERTNVVLDNPMIVMAGLTSSLMLSGIIYSLIHSTSLNTSDIHHIHMHTSSSSSRLAYFARKSNILNTIFVKRAWGWTSLLYLLHLFSSPSSPSTSSSRNKIRRLGPWVLATFAWLLFTRWFFGAGLGDRIIAITGGNCALPLPKEIDYTSARNTFPSLFTSGSSTSGAGEGQEGRLYLPLPAEYCSSKRIDSNSFPELFALLPSLNNDNGNGIELMKEATTNHPSLKALPRPRWHKGFDISGHAFLLTLSIMILARELAPTWRTLINRTTTTNKDAITKTQQSHSRKGWTGIEILHIVSTMLASTLLGIWLWMLLMTAVYFHNPPEKLSGLGLATSWLINILFPDSSSDLSDDAYVSPISTLTGSKDTSFIPLGKRLDENAARRGEVVDDGMILEIDEDEKIHDEVDAKGRLKAKVE